MTTETANTPSPASPVPLHVEKGLAATLDCISVGFALVGSDGRLLHANPAARSLLAEGHALRLDAGRVVGADAVARLQLAALLAAAEKSTPQQPTLMRLVQAAVGGGELEVMASAFPDRPRVVALVLSAPHCVPAGAATVLQRLYGLTAAEAQLVLGLARGLTLAEIAVRQSVALATLRSHLHRALRKTGRRRQAELVTLVTAGLAGRFDWAAVNVASASLPLHQMNESEPDTSRAATDAAATCRAALQPVPLRSVAAASSARAARRLASIG